MIAVLDVSAAIELLLEKEKAPLFKEAIARASWVIAPDLFVSELSNVAWKYCRAKAISHSEAIQLAEDGITLIDDFIPAEELWKEALSEGIKRSHSVYDMLYATLARRNDAVIITNDRGLADICRKMHVTLCI
ncbi:MAG: type II toxin-antitoxin system VapC family toxin [Spirochaetota bacterium]